jgi:hypothetical protein
LDAKVPPTAIILRDPGRKEYGVWDLKLAAAIHIYDDLMRGNIPVYWDESDRVAFDVKVGMSKSRRAIDTREERDTKNKVDMKGKYYYAVPRVTDGGALPTLDEWLAERKAKEGNSRQEGPKRTTLLGLDGNPLQR